MVSSLAEMGEVSKFMAEIIRLLTDLVAAVKKNEDLLIESQTILKNSQAMIEGLSQSAGMKNIAAAGQSLESAITMLQKGVQAMEIQNALRQVQQFLGQMGGMSGIGPVAAPQSGSPQSPGAGGPAKKSGEDSLIKPSDLFK